MAQGAKPGEGGQLPGHKVDERIAKVRWSTPGVTLISPPPHHDIYSIEDLAQLIYDLQSVNPAARVSVKLVSEVGVGTIAAGVAKAGAGGVVISGYEGGTGASPLSQHQARGPAVGAGAGGDAAGAGAQRAARPHPRPGGRRPAHRAATCSSPRCSAPRSSAWPPRASSRSGCIMLRKCHLNTCSVGIATQDAGLREQLPRQARARGELLLPRRRGPARGRWRRWACARLDELVGRVDLLRQRARRRPLEGASGWTSPALLALPRAPAAEPRRCDSPWAQGRVGPPGPRPAPAREGDAGGRGAHDCWCCRSSNTHRAVGAMLSGEIARRYGARGLPGRRIRDPAAAARPGRASAPSSPAA